VCITAGTVTLKTRLESGSLSEEINLTQFNSVVFANKEIKINNAIPLREQRDILPSEYSFEFSVKSTSTTPQCTVDADCPQLISAGANSMFPTNRCINNKCVLEQIN